MRISELCQAVGGRSITLRLNPSPGQMSFVFVRIPVRKFNKFADAPLSPDGQCSNFLIGLRTPGSSARRPSFTHMVTLSLSQRVSRDPAMRESSEFRSGGFAFTSNQPKSPARLLRLTGVHIPICPMGFRASFPFPRRNPCR